VLSKTASEFEMPKKSLAPEQADAAGVDVVDIATGEGTPNLDTILRIPVTVQVVLGSAVMPVANLMKLGRGTVIPLDQRVGEPVDIVVNGRVVARGEVVVADEDTSRFGVSLTELLGPTAAGPKD
jgi:flagellar motor switch protein FliN